MGILKQDLQLGGMHILDRVLKALLTDTIQELYVVGGPFRLLPSIQDERIKVTYNDQHCLGMGSSIGRGMEMLSSDEMPVLIHLLDKPLLLPETVQVLMDRFLYYKPRVLLPVFQGVKGHPVIFHQDLYPQLFSLKGRPGGREIIENQKKEDVLPVLVNDPGTILDLDSWEDYVRLCRLCGDDILA